MDRRQFFKLAAAAAVATQLPNIPVVEDKLGGWLLCDGSELSATKYQTLHSIIGKLYGGSENSFKLPDLRAATIKVKGTPYVAHFIKVRENTFNDQYPIGSIIHCLRG
jgi:hypothetical protein